MIRAMEKLARVWRTNPATLLGIAGIAVFTGNILIGRHRQSTGTGTASPLDGVPEFLLLCLSIICFVVSMVSAEKRAARRDEEI